VHRDEMEKIERKGGLGAGGAEEGAGPGPERQAEFATTSGIALERVYTPLDWPSTTTAGLGFPATPLHPGRPATMYRGRFWTMRQYAGFGTAEESKPRYKYLLRRDRRAFRAFDLPTAMGYDSTAHWWRAEVGKVGCGGFVATWRRSSRASAGQGQHFHDDQRHASILLCMYIAVAEAAGRRPKQLTARSRTTS